MLKSIFKVSLLMCFVTCVGLATQAKHGNLHTISLGGMPVDTLKIVYFGSSVPYGWGAKDLKGYTYLFTQILKERTANGSGKAWTTVNKSIGGDNTIKLMSRWQKDLASQKAKYVIYALSLGNEGLHESGKVKFDQFKTNMLKLIAMARDSGYVPVLTNCYTRNDFTEADYNYTRQMNLWINSLDVPSINLLGAVDDGTGKWAAHYWFDPGHPNDAGHAELSYTIVPSLFDALSNHKPQPKWVNSTGVTWGKVTKTNLLDFKPDNKLHPFTTTVTIKADGKGQIFLLKDSTGKTGIVAINSKGTIEYTSPSKQTLTGSDRVTDGQWHKITLTYYHARGHVDIYLDGTLQASGPEKMAITEFELGDTHPAKSITAKNWLFYRSGMNFSEIRALAADSLLKSSLELYAPLGDKGMANLAQSTNTLKWKHD